MTFTNLLLRFSFFILIIPLIKPNNIIKKNNLHFKVAGVPKDIRTNIKNSLLNIMSELKKNISNSAYAQSIIRDNVKRSIEVYGFFNPKIEVIIDDVHIKINIVLGKPAIITTYDIKFIQNNVGIINDISQYSLKNQQFNIEKYQKNNEEIISTLKKIGYIFAMMDSKKVIVDRESNTVEIFLTISANYKQFFGSITYNNTLLSEDFLKKIIIIKEKDIFSIEKINKTYTNLQETGYFSKIEIKESANFTNQKLQKIPINIELSSNNTSVLKLKAGYNSDTKFLGKIENYWNIINKYGHTLRIEGLYTAKQSQKKASYKVPTFSKNKAYYEFIFDDTLIKNTSQGTSENNKLIFSYNFIINNINTTTGIEYYRYKKIELNSNSNNRKNYVSLYVDNKYKLINDLVSPTKGFSITASIIIGKPVNQINSKYHFLKLSLIFSHLYTINDINIINKIKLSGLACEDFKELPDLYQLKEGGQEFLKGFRFHSITGFNKCILYCLDVRFPIFDKFKLGLFIDYGNTNVDKFRNIYDIGFQIIYKSDFGDVSLGFAKAINPKDNNFIFQFNIGSGI